jgi:hypothetical protein
MAVGRGEAMRTQSRSRGERVIVAKRFFTRVLVRGVSELLQARLSRRQCACKRVRAKETKG